MIVPKQSFVNPLRDSIICNGLGGGSPFCFAVPRPSTVPSVTRVLSDTMPPDRRAMLARWEKKKTQELGEEGFKRMKENTFNRGHALHSIVESYMSSGSLPSPSSLPDLVSQRHLVSVSQVLKQFSWPGFALESAVLHPHLGYGGIIDCVATMDQELVLVDWKTSEKVKNSTASLYDAPLQVAAYLGAINADPRYDALGNIKKGAVVVIYNSGYPAVIHQFSQRKMENLWSQWLQRLERFKSSK